jgi:hypothetical protein
MDLDNIVMCTPYFDERSVSAFQVFGSVGAVVIERNR